MKNNKLLSLTGSAVALMVMSGQALAEPTIPTPVHDSAHHHYHDTKGFANPELLKLLKVDAKTLHQDLKAGKSIADIASEHGVPKQSVTDLLIKQATERIQQAVKSGKMTQEKANQLTSKLPEKMNKLVEKKGGFGHGKRHGHYGIIKSAATMLGMSVEDLKSQLKSGKSLADISTSQGKDKQVLIDSMVKQATEKIDGAVKDGKMTPDKAQQIKGKLPGKMKKLVERKDLCSKTSHEKEDK